MGRLVLSSLTEKNPKSNFKFGQNSKTNIFGNLPPGNGGTPDRDPGGAGSPPEGPPGSKGLTVDTKGKALNLHI